MRRFPAVARALCLAAWLAVPAQPGAAETMAEMFPSYADWISDDLVPQFGALTIHRGTQAMAEGEFALELGDDFYILRDADAQWVYTNLWQNLPDPELKALIFQNATTPLDQSWAVAAYYFEDGHISDEDAATMDYGAIVEARQAEEPELNRQREATGLPALYNIGLTGTPGYDRETRSLKFAVLLGQEGSPDNYLNASAWVLSRHGFVYLNVLGAPSQAAEIDARMPDLVKLVSLAEGNRYADYVMGMDAVAEGGLGALLGGGAGQAGLVIVALTLLKKFGFLLIVPVAWIFKRLRGTGSGA